MDKIEEEERQLQEFLLALKDYNPTIPEEVIDHYLKRTGFVCSDQRVQKLISLAAQKFISDVANDALQYCKVRQQNAQQRSKNKRLILSMDDLSQALKEYGIHINKPPYYASKPGSSGKR